MGAVIHANGMLGKSSSLFSKIRGHLAPTQWKANRRQCQCQLSTHSTIVRRRPIAKSAPPASVWARRLASTDSKAVGNSSRNFLYGSAAVLLLSFGYLYTTDTRASIHQWLVVPALRLFHSDPEEAHHAGIRYIKVLYDFNLHPRERGRKDEELGDLSIEVFGHVLDNPIGTSAGIDKNAEIPSPLLELGPAIVEVGGATPIPQTGNARPRVFRIPSQNALINRYGLNSEGADFMAMQLRERVRAYAYANGLGLEPESERLVLDGEAGVPPGSLRPGRLLAVQIAKNKTTPDNDIGAIASDYVYCVDQLARYADILVVNVSSPNTPGLRDLQATAPLTTILSAVVDAAKSCDRKTKPAVMVKVSPDEDSDSQVDGICSAVWASGVDGVIVGNTTKKRPDPIPQGYVLPRREEALLTEAGGYSGPQMFERTLQLVRKYRTKLDRGPQLDAPVHFSDSIPAQATETVQAADETSPDMVDRNVQRDLQHLKPFTKTSLDKDGGQPLIRIPESQTEHSNDPANTTPANPSDTPSRVSTSSDVVKPSTGGNPSQSSSITAVAEPKVIFATGGITNGEQCLQVLNAGASVCQVYTAMMYGGVGTVTRMKDEMRRGMKAEKDDD